jgi:leader peptidase (prepilin peptidase) / N-methyltransferase
MDSIADWTLRLGWILPAWLFALGGIVGSFLNVVVYRLPAGRSIAYPGSQCPACGHPIRWYQNLPIVSWLLLGGRCHDCRAKISARYPLVELITAMLFVGLFLADARPRMIAFADPAATESMYSGRDVLIRYAGDLWLLCTLLASALIEYDGGRVPRRIFGIAIAVGFLVGAGIASPGAAGQAIVIAATGLIAGLAIGSLFDIALMKRFFQPERNSRYRHLTALSLASVGTLLGWAATIAIGLIAASALVATRIVARSQNSAAHRWGFGGFTFLATLGWIVAAHWLRLPFPLTPDL